MFASAAALCLLLALCCLRYSACAPTGNPEKCGGVVLSENQICCREKVLNIPDGNYNCCVSINDEITVYNRKQQYCSPDGEIKNLPSRIYLPTKKAKEQPRNAIVCRGIIYHNVSTSDFECCRETLYHKNDKSNPCKGFCGEKTYNSEYQLCCEDKIYDSPHPDMKCCKDALINTDTHDCCNSSVPVHKKDGFFCCAEVNVYHNATMTCDEISGKVHLRPSFFNMFFNPADLCTLEAGWRPLTFNDFLGITITGMVDSCNIKSRRRELIIPLSPFSVTSNGLPVNVEGDENVFKVRVRFNKKCHDRISALMSSLKKKALVVHTTNTSFLSKRKPELLIQRGEKSFVSLREAKLDIVQEQSILLSMKRS